MKSLVAGTTIVLALLTPACRTKKTPPPVVQPDTTTMAPPPVEPPPVTVAPPSDFVQEKPITEETLPSDFEELNRMVQDRGYIQDAFFSYNESGLSTEAQAALSSSASWLRKNTQYNVLVEGHCDERGTEQYNLALGDRRANVARDYLITQGVEASRIRTVSYGEERPFDPGHDESAWSKNRRAHLVLVGK